MSDHELQVESVKLTALHLRLAMAALPINRIELAERTGVSRSTIRRVLDGGGMRPATNEMLLTAFRAAGIIFIQPDENGGVGIRVSERATSIG